MFKRSRVSQSGSVLANLAFGTAAIGSMAAVSVDWTAQQSALAVQQQQGYLFATLNDSVGNYMTLLFPQLTDPSASGVDAIPAECAKLPFRVGTSESVEPVILQGKCQLSLPLAAGGSYVIPNAYQPTLADLKSLGLLDHGVSDVPVLTTESLVAGPDAAGMASSTPAPNTYAISISPKCLGLGSSATICNNTNKALSSSVINIQPFVESTYIQNFTPLMLAAGPDAAISGPRDAENVVLQADRANPTGEFRSIQAAWIRENPVTKVWNYSTSSGNSSYTRGVDNLVVMRNGYDSAYWQLTRRDGASLPTANWDFNGKDLTNVGKFTAVSGEVSGDLQVGGNQTVAGNQVVKGDQSVTGNVTVDGTATFKGVLTAMADLLVKGSTELQGKLTVLGKAVFKEDVTLEKNLQVKGNVQIDGDLSAGSATFNGALLANSLMIGGTQITADGTLLGGRTGWGVTTGAACSVELALAQSTDGKVQICRNAGWTPLITNENIVKPAPAPDQACSPEGSPGRLPDGTLVICTNGKWESIAQGGAAEGSACMVEGSLATTTVHPNPGRILMACQSGKWSTSVFSKPRLGYAQSGETCQTQDEMAYDNKSGFYTAVICDGGKWRPEGLQMLANMEMGRSCSLEGVLASDMERTGLLVCKGGVWSKITDPIGMGGSCSPEGKRVITPSGTPMWCSNGVWTGFPKPGERCSPVGKTFEVSTGPKKMLYCNMAHEGDIWSETPGTLKLYTFHGTPVTMSRLVQYNGEDYYIYSERGDGAYTTQKMHHIAWWLLEESDPVAVTSVRRTSASEFGSLPQGHTWTSAANGMSQLESASDRCNAYQVMLPSHNEIRGLATTFGGRPRQWSFVDTELWTNVRCDESFCNGGNWWDHLTIDLDMQITRHRWNTDHWAVALKVRRPWAGASCGSPQ